VESKNQKKLIKLLKCVIENLSKNKLFSTGGSDNHSKQGVSNLVGMHGGDNNWLDEFLEHLNINYKIENQG